MATAGNATCDIVSAPRSEESKLIRFASSELQFAAANGHHAEVLRLLALGSDVNSQDRMGERSLTHLIFAVMLIPSICRSNCFDGVT
jgi:hypothetical protein